MTGFPRLHVDDLGNQLPSGFYQLTDGQVEVPVRYKKGTRDVLVILFHGAVDRTSRTIPKFQAFMPDSDVHQLSIADPSLSLDEDLAAAWYIGGKNMPLQTALPKMISVLAKVLGLERRVYLGGASGGFAALFYSWSDPGSVCIAINPQVKLANYIPRIVKSYAEIAWPGATSIADIEDKCTVDVTKLYAEGFENFVIYAQSVGDVRHFSQQLPEFAAEAFGAPEKFILQCGYWGTPGHSNSIPSVWYYNWVRAVAVSPSLKRQDLLDTHHVLSSSKEHVPGVRTSAKGKVPHDPVDIERATLLSSLLLKT